MSKRTETLYTSLSKPLTWVDTVAKLKLLSDKLNKVEEFAVDIEQHGYRSYQGFCCLVQISTREEDFIVDAQILRNQLQILNQSFTNPNIVKVLHGADNDVLWLQRDFGLYLVNLFDTHQAVRQLDFRKFSFDYVLQHYCNVKSEDKKKYQLADWRIRPLPQDMIDYARSDTHYSLYIYDRLTNELIDKSTSTNLLLVALNKSREITLQSYSKELFQPSLPSLLKKVPEYNPLQVCFSSLLSFFHCCFLHSFSPLTSLYLLSAQCRSRTHSFRSSFSSFFVLSPIRYLFFSSPIFYSFYSTSSRIPLPLSLPFFLDILFCISFLCGSFWCGD